MRHWRIIAVTLGVFASAAGIGLAAEHHVPLPVLYSLEGAWVFFIGIALFLSLRGKDEK